MARRDIFRNITNATEAEVHAPERKSTPGYAARGATRNMLASIGELADKAAKAQQLLEGAAVTELDPGLIDASFVTDRLAQDDEAFEELLSAIRDRGQDSPVLVRPHPQQPGRYQIVFGHRRVRAARLLDRPVKAVIRQVDDIDHVVAQGQENSARENLSFIERAAFAKQLVDRGYDRPTIQSALAVDAPMLTRMLSVASRVPPAVVSGIGAAKGIGRDRWLELAQLIENPANLAGANELLTAREFAQAASDTRFEMVFHRLKRPVRAIRGEIVKPAKTKWQSADKSVSADLTDTGKAFALSLKSKDARRFGQYLASNLDRLYREFREEASDQEQTNKQ